MTDVGPHLLGRKVSPPDARDFPLSAFLADATESPLDAALANLLTSKSVAKATKEWAVVATPLLKMIEPQPTPVPTPEPTPEPEPSGPVSWVDNEPVLDQGNTGHCGGFSGAQWGNTLPVADKFTNDDGHRFYYECKVIDGEPNSEDGTYIRSVAKALKQDGRLDVYAFAKSVDEAIQWLMKNGPVIFGTDWYTGMFDPDENGVIYPTGQVEGGHAYIAIGYNPETEMIEYLNSWSDQWGVKGHFYMHKSDAESVFQNYGEALVAVELP